MFESSGEAGNSELSKGGMQIASGVTVVLPESQMIDETGQTLGRFFEANIADVLKSEG